MSNGTGSLEKMELLAARILPILLGFHGFSP